MRKIVAIIAGFGLFLLLSGGALARCHMVFKIVNNTKHTIESFSIMGRNTAGFLCKNRLKPKDSCTFIATAASLFCRDRVSLDVYGFFKEYKKNKYYPNDNDGSPEIKNGQRWIGSIVEPCVKKGGYHHGAYLCKVNWSED